LVKLFKQLKEDLDLFRDTIKSLCGNSNARTHRYPLQVNDDRLIKRSDHLNRLYLAISPTLGACASDCQLHRVKLLLAQLELNNGVYSEKGPTEDTSCLSVLIPTKNGPMMSREWQFVELKSDSEFGNEALLAYHTSKSAANKNLIQIRLCLIIMKQMVPYGGLNWTSYAAVGLKS
jgi:hypothetical protein